MLDCEPGWDLFEKNCYKFFMEQKNQSSAKKACVDSGAHLISIHSDEENQFLNSKITKSIWIGLEWKDNGYQWSDGSDFDYEKWVPGEPSNPGFENCSTLLYNPNSRHHKKWIDVHCGLIINYACKKKLKGTSSIL